MHLLFNQPSTLYLHLSEQWNRSCIYKFQIHAWVWSSKSVMAIENYSDITLPSPHLKSPSTQLFVQLVLRLSTKKTSKLWNNGILSLVYSPHKSFPWHYLIMISVHLISPADKLDCELILDSLPLVVWNRFPNAMFNHGLLIGIFRHFYDNTLRLMLQDVTDDWKSTLVQAIVWCHKTTSHYFVQSAKDVKIYVMGVHPYDRSLYPLI